MTSIISVVRDIFVGPNPPAGGAPTPAPGGTGGRRPVSETPKPGGADDIGAKLERIQALEDQLAAERALQAKRLAALAGCEDCVDPPPSVEDIAKAVDEAKKRFEELQQQLKDEAAKQLGAIDKFNSDYDKLWTQAVRGTEDYMRHYPDLLRDMEALWAAFGDREWAHKVAEWVDTGIQAAMIGLDVYHAGAGLVKGLARGGEEVVAIGGKALAKDGETIAGAGAGAVERDAVARAAEEQAAREAAERAAQEQAAKEAAEKAAQEQAAKEAAEKAAQEQAAKEAAEKAAQEQAAKEVAEKAAQEQAAKEAAEKAAQEQAAKEAAEKAAQEQAAKDAASEAKAKADVEAAEKAIADGKRQKEIIQGEQLQREAKQIDARARAGADQVAQRQAAATQARVEAEARLAAAGPNPPANLVQEVAEKRVLDQAAKINQSYGRFAGDNTNCYICADRFERAAAGGNFGSAGTDVLGTGGTDSMLEQLHGSQFRPVNDKAAIDALMAGKSDARGMVSVDWQKGGGHVFNVVNRDGVTVYVDAQSGKLFNDWGKASKIYFMPTH